MKKLQIKVLYLLNYISLLFLHVLNISFAKLVLHALHSFEVSICVIVSPLIPSVNCSIIVQFILYWVHKHHSPYEVIEKATRHNNPILCLNWEEWRTPKNNPLYFKQSTTSLLGFLVVVHLSNHLSDIVVLYMGQKIPLHYKKRALELRFSKMQLQGTVWAAFYKNAVPPLDINVAPSLDI